MHKVSMTEEEKRLWEAAKEGAGGRRQAADFGGDLARQLANVAIAG